MDEFNFEMEPGRKKYNNRIYIDTEPIISVIVPFFNSGEYIEQTIISILNQTFPCYEILIIDDGSTDEKSLRKLQNIKKIDSRIKVFHKENEGLATARDFGASKSSEKAEYLMFLDDDDLLEPTFLECGYWTLETNKDASWAYSDSVGFGKMRYTWNKYFCSKKLKKENELISEALIRKKDFYTVNGYDLKEKSVNEDWNFWLKLISKRKYPVHMSFYGQWYRRKENGELKKSKENKKRSLQIINETANKITEEVNAIQYPRYNYNYDLIPDEIDSILVSKLKDEEKKIKLLFIIPWMITGGADLFNLELVKRLDKSKYIVTIISTEPNKNVLRQYFECNENCKVYDLTSFIDQKYWLAFINYIIKKENINIILNSNSKFGYSALPYLKSKYPQIPIIDYVHMEEWYNRNGGYSRYSTMHNSIIDKTLLCNENSRKILINHFGRNECELKTVYIGVDTKRFDPENYNKDELKRKYLGAVSDKKIISFICRISEQKRPMLFLKIIAELKTIRKDFKVFIVGDGNLLDRMKKQAKKLKLSDDIIFLGNLKDTTEIYSISDLTVNCSLKEGLALTSYESLSMNVPVVSSNTGGQKELITPEVGEIIELMQDENDVYCENYKDQEIENYVKAINKVLNNPEIYKKNCRKKICENFTIEKMIENISNIFEEIYNAPNKEKIENGQGLSKNLNIAKELITQSLKNDEAQYLWECKEYERMFYRIPYSTVGMNYKKEILKEKLWRVPLWRRVINVYHKIMH